MQVPVGPVEPICQVRFGSWRPSDLSNSRLPTAMLMPLDNLATARHWTQEQCSGLTLVPSWARERGYSLALHLSVFG